MCFSLLFEDVFVLTQIGNTYNIPIRLWILDSHPFAPPICFLKPTANMGILVGKHVDAQGRIYLPYLQNWSHVRSIWIFFWKFLFFWMFIFDTDGTNKLLNFLSVIFFFWSWKIIWNWTPWGSPKSQHPGDSSLLESALSKSGSQPLFTPCLFTVVCCLIKQMKNY